MEDKVKSKILKTIKGDFYKHIYYHLDKLEYSEFDKRDFSNYTEPASKNKDKHITPLPKLVLSDIFKLFVDLASEDGEVLDLYSNLASFDDQEVNSYFHCSYIELAIKNGFDNPRKAADKMCSVFARFIYHVTWLIACCLTEKIKLTHPLYKALVKTLV